MNSKIEYTGHNKHAVRDGSTFPISQIGASYLPTCKPIILRRLLLVPSIKKNLISICNSTFDNDVIVEFNSSHSISPRPFFSPTCDGLYQPDLSLPLPSASSTSVAASSAYHLTAPCNLASAAVNLFSVVTSTCHTCN